MQAYRFRISGPAAVARGTGSGLQPDPAPVLTVACRIASCASADPRPSQIHNVDVARGRRRGNRKAAPSFSSHTAAFFAASLRNLCPATETSTRIQLHIACSAARVAVPIAASLFPLSVPHRTRVLFVAALHVLVGIRILLLFGTGILVRPRTIFLVRGPGACAILLPLCIVLAFATFGVLVRAFFRVIISLLAFVAFVTRLRSRFAAGPRASLFGFMFAVFRVVHVFVLQIAVQQVVHVQGDALKICILCDPGLNTDIIGIGTVGRRSILFLRILVVFFFIKELYFGVLLFCFCSGCSFLLCLLLHLCLLL
mmetsp:Transcript_4794/g.11787  ORF Transcript_4794/g.11787 Transcript_4794/m.11787 type:complete len:312 (+) Transcript_4794:2010-2945(+)